METSRPAHWQNVYATKPETAVSWFEERPEVSLELIDSTGLGREARVVDIGAGASRLVDALVTRGQAAVTALDVSAGALEITKQRLGAAADRVTWVVSDVLTWRPSEAAYDTWHDRAAFHFLTAPEDQAAYARLMARAVRRGGFAIIGTFAPDGPERCSGLPVARHDADDLSRLFAADFALVQTRRHEHHTPGGAVQKFQFCVFRRTGA
jgi:SAM-dependent methyltransferase